MYTYMRTRECVCMYAWVRVGLCVKSHLAASARDTPSKPTEAAPRCAPSSPPGSPAPPTSPPDLSVLSAGPWWYQYDSIDRGDKALTLTRPCVCTDRSELLITFSSRLYRIASCTSTVFRDSLYDTGYLHTPFYRYHNLNDWRLPNTTKTITSCSSQSKRMSREVVIRA